MKKFDRQYFDKWYRDPTHRIGTTADLERQVRLAVSAAEYMLTRPIKTVLDVGAGEARWQPIIKKIRPTARYTGVDPSPYSIQKFGKRRNIIEGSFDDLARLFRDKKFDLVVCCSVLNYLSHEACGRAIQQLANHTGGVAYLEIFTSEDDIIGDTSQWHVQPARAYHRQLTSAGLLACGMHCYIPRDERHVAAALELSRP